MKPWRLIANFFVCFFVSSTALAQARSMHTYTSSDGTFEFKYSEPLILCQTGTKKLPENWAPIESCEDQRPLCADSSGAGSAVACIAYPHARLEGYNLLHATFSVNTIPTVKTEAECRQMPPDAERVKEPKEKTIHGTKYLIIHTGDAGLSHSWDISGYRTFHDGICYELTTVASWVSTGAYDPGEIKVPTRQMRHRIDESLQQALNSFRFLK